MDLKNKTLEDWLQNPPVSAYPLKKRVDYYTHYKKLKDYLLTEVHDQVTLGASLKNPDILINDHGPDHIATVIERATRLVECTECSLSPLEVYFLLMSIQLHDVGNIFGRYDHELNAKNIMSEAEKLCGRDTVELKTINNIVETHGGEIRGVSDGKDKISFLNKDDNLLEDTIRTQAIASILRFADELADDKRRAFTTLLKNNSIPKKSEIFHAYASTLDSVIINHKDKAVELNFNIPKDFAVRTFGKIDEDVLLLDEIYTRIMKMHVERIYCMRFLKGIIDIEKISVAINFYDKYVDIFPQISFEITESGYPKSKKDGIYDICKSLWNDNGTKINGEHVKDEIIRYHSG